MDPTVPQPLDAQRIAGLLKLKSTKPTLIYAALENVVIQCVRSQKEYKQIMDMHCQLIADLKNALGFEDTDNIDREELLNRVRLLALVQSK